ncbi:phage tail tape measure protein [Streptomyces sp. RKAG293]|uniref:phage tail tape measure protein n=1 Tax=Streptomyces sp. RKAG293 TaxID=2893403 RepID=UPI0020341A4E|nr:phage tail tape measure protein [Streptomyces sp. RKAG293]MCM2420308.1 phage tail tape measure protein [Streptomyces sp. RKAG293]
MALLVGELAATISVDDSGATAGVRRAEQTMQAGGDRMVATADRAGQQAGDQLGAGLADGANDGADRASNGLSGKLKGFAAAAIGAGIGIALMAGINEAMDQAKITGHLQAQLGATGPVAAKYGKAAGALYAGAIVESVQDGADIIKGIAQNGLLPPEATQAQIQTMGKRVADTAAVMGEDVGKVSRAVGTMLKTGIAKSADEAMDVLVRGSQNGVNAAEDLLDTFSEYPTQFRDLGLDAQTAMGLMQQGLKGGARDADTVADTLKEFAIRSKDMSTTSVDAFKSIGLNGGTMAKVFTKGGPAASAALGDVLKRIKAIEDPAKRNATAVALFGTKAEDLQGALYKLDPSTAVKALGDVKGATDAAGNSMRDNASTRIEVFKRSLTQGFVQLLGRYVIPGVIIFAKVLGTLGGKLRTSAGYVDEHRLAFSILAGMITAVLLPTLIVLAVQAVTTSATAVAAWVAQSAAGTLAAGRFLITNAVMLAGWISQGAAAGLAALRVVAAWVIMGTQSLIQAGRMAAAWLISMGPVGLIIALVVGLVALIVANWDTIVSATVAAWDWIWAKVKAVAGFLVDIFLNFTLVGLILSHWQAIKDGTVAGWNATLGFVKGIPGRLYSLFLNWTLYGLIISHWQAIKDGTQRKAGEMLAYVRGLPGAIAGYFSGFGSLLYGKGRDLVYGLWNGIKGMGPWLRSTLMSWASRMIPGPIAKALGIHSPSRVMRDEIGRHIPAGLVAGITSGQGAVDDAMANLVSTPRASAALGITAGTPGAGPAGSTAAGPEIRVVFDARGSDDLTRWLRKTVRIEGRGNVQTAFGT